MSLKHFHVFFINASLLLSIGFAYWCFAVSAGDNGEALMGVLAAIFSISLIVYQLWFLKMRREIEAGS